MIGQTISHKKIRCNILEKFGRRVGLVVSSLLLLKVLGCRDAGTDPDLLVTAPEIKTVSIQPNPNNVVSTVVHATVSHAAVVAVEYGRDSLHLQTTPSIAVASDSVIVPVLGLSASTSYIMRAAAFSSIGTVARSGFQQFITDSLPTDIPRLERTFSVNPSPGYIMMGFNAPASGRSYALIIDNEANVVMYRAFDGPVGDFQKQPNGHYTAVASLNGESTRFYEFDGLGNILKEYQATGVDETDVHELRIVGSEYVLFGAEYRTMDLSSLGGLVNARVRGITVEYSRSQSQPLVWHTFDHFSVSDAAPDIPLTGQDVNPWHGNAIDIDADGNLIASFRNMDEITKINAHTGEIIWRLGGRHNQFTFVNDPMGGFSHQHGVRRLSNGNIILFDNGNLHSPPMSRAVEYRLDEANHTATLVWEYRPQPSLFALFLGFAQRLSNGNTLVCFGIARRVIEVDAQGNKQWDLSVNDPAKAPYRAIRIDSL
jgi:hypothetical protein